MNGKKEEVRKTAEGAGKERESQEEKSEEYFLKLSFSICAIHVFILPHRPHRCLNFPACYNDLCSCEECDHG
jgi:hypothetical protein